MDDLTRSHSEQIAGVINNHNHNIDKAGGESVIHQGPVHASAPMTQTGGMTTLVVMTSMLRVQLGAEANTKCSRLERCGTRRSDGRRSIMSTMQEDPRDRPEAPIEMFFV